MKRKINTKLVKSNDAVSAVIGVILMVAVTVAIAATVFIYVNNMTQIDETAPQILGVQSNIADGVTIEMTGASLDPGSVRITVTDAQDKVAIIDDSLAPGTQFDLDGDQLPAASPGTPADTTTTGDLSNFTWIDTGGDGKLGGGDILKLTNDGGLATGTWYVRIIDLQSGKPSMSLSVDII